VDWSKLEARDEEGSFSGLLAGELYYAAVIEDGKEKEKYEQQQRERASAFAERLSRPALASEEDAQLSRERCSCVEGNPCATPENCFDFPNRFENARKVMQKRGTRGAEAAGGGGAGGNIVNWGECTTCRRCTLPLVFITHPHPLHDFCPSIAQRRLHREEALAPFFSPAHCSAPRHSAKCNA
jgi:hypothetical protein